jgi:IS5 family transposase
VASGVGAARTQLIDSTVIRAHRHGRRSDERGSCSSASSRPRVGFSTKIHALTEAHGLPTEVYLTPGQAACTSAASALLAGAEQCPREVLADKVYESDELWAELYLRKRPGWPLCRG